MSDLKRFDPVIEIEPYTGSESAVMEEDSCGEYVQGTDYASLQQQNTALQQQVKDLEAEKSRYSMSAGAADQFRAEALASREALGFSCESDCVSPSDISSTIAEIKAAAIREAIEKHSYSIMNFNHDFVRVCETSRLEDYANTLSSKGGD